MILLLWLCVVSEFERLQFGIPPETIKDSMRLGMDVPTVYIVPVERFCREQGPSLGVNLAVSFSGLVGSCA